MPASCWPTSKTGWRCWLRGDRRLVDGRLAFRRPRTVAAMTRYPGRAGRSAPSRIADESRHAHLAEAYRTRPARAALMSGMGSTIRVQGLLAPPYRRRAPAVRLERHYPGRAGKSAHTPTSPGPSP
jgi:hypothetical protein